MTYVELNINCCIIKFISKTSCPPFLSRPRRAPRVLGPSCGVRGARGPGGPGPGSPCVPPQRPQGLLDPGVPNGPRVLFPRAPISGPLGAPRSPPGPSVGVGSTASSGPEERPGARGSCGPRGPQIGHRGPPGACPPGAPEAPAAPRPLSPPAQEPLGAWGSPGSLGLSAGARDLGAPGGSRGPMTPGALGWPPGRRTPGPPPPLGLRPRPQGASLALLP